MFEEAKKLGAADEENIITQRKLVLLVDLDQTLIHTTNEDVDPKTKVSFFKHLDLHKPSRMTFSRDCNRWYN